jgi:glutamate---cysteine ligase / carboxylate-amine ligase
MLLAPDSLELSPVAPDVLALLSGDPRFKLELPASQIEITTRSRARVSEIAQELLDARRVLVERSGELVRVAAAGAHPFSPGVGELNAIPRYEGTIQEYGAVAARQLVCALQVHVGVGDAGRTLAVYNAARAYLPLIAALAANAPFYEGRDTGLASVRPKLGELLPRQGIPPSIASWDDYAEILRWGEASGTFPSAQTWWWELRLHPSFGTLEFRVPDAQSSVADAAAIAAVAQSLVAWLGQRHDGGERLPAPHRWQIEENRWSACRYGVEGDMVEIATAARRPTREMVGELLDTLAPIAARLTSTPQLERAREMVHANGAIVQRRVAQRDGARSLTRWLTERFLDPI